MSRTDSIYPGDCLIQQGSQSVEIKDLFGKVEYCTGEIIRSGLSHLPVVYHQSFMLFVVLLASLFSITGQASATATLEFSAISVPPTAQSATVPLILSTDGQKVAALQLDILYNPSILDITATGCIKASAATETAGKQITYSLLTPGKVRMLIVGFNQTAIPSGEIASVLLTFKGKFTAEEPLRIQNALLSDPNGAKIQVKGKDGGISLIAATVSKKDETKPAIQLEKNYLPLLILAGLLVILIFGGVLWRYNPWSRALEPPKGSGKRVNARRNVQHRYKA